jgi:hypothetical protein
MDSVKITAGVFSTALIDVTTVLLDSLDDDLLTSVTMLASVPVE